jgi:uroporphyrinogen-III decarboxylase
MIQMGESATNRERMLATLNGEILDYVPSWCQSFYNLDTARRILPPDLQIDELGIWPTEGMYDFSPQDPRELDRIIAMNRYIGRIATSAGKGANLQFGHGGPGEFNARVVARGAQVSVLQYETGAKARVRKDPHFYQLFDMPVKGVADLEQTALPDPEDPLRWEGFRRDVSYLRAHGEYTVGWINGFFSGCHYFFCDFQEFLTYLVTDPLLVERLLQKLGDWNLKAAQMMLQTNVDCIGFCEDLGTGEALLFRPELYDRFFFPWHRALCELAHSYGAHVHMHSHGNINKVLDRLVVAGIDMLNPLDPTEGMDLALIKERYGNRLTLVGGMDKNVFDQRLDEIELRLQRSISIGAKGGRFVMMDTGGIPDTISRSKFEAFLDISRRVRGEVI